MAYGDFKDLTRRTVTDEILRDKAKKMIDIKGVLLGWFIIKFLIEKHLVEQSKQKLCLIKISGRVT